jgi:hypothetical protein
MTTQLFAPRAHALLLALSVFGLSTATALAQDERFYGPTGDYEGTARTDGDTTRFYSPTGDYLGTARKDGDTTRFYGPTGDYQGTARTQEPTTPARPVYPPRRY